MSGDGVVAHNRRTYFAENVDPARTHLNIEYCYTPIKEAYHQLFDFQWVEENPGDVEIPNCPNRNTMPLRSLLAGVHGHKSLYHQQARSVPSAERQMRQMWKTRIRLRIEGTN